MNVPSVIVKLVAAARAESLGATRPVSAVVLHVTESRELRLESGCTKMALLAVTAVVAMTHVPAEEFVAQLNEPDGAAAQATSDGPAAEPAAAHFVFVTKSGEVTEVTASNVPGAMNVEGTESVHEPDAVIGVAPVTVT